MTRRVVAALLLVVPVALVVLAGPAAAHATLDSTTPAASQQLKTSPKQVTLTFDETVTTTPSSVRLFDGNGTRVETGRVERRGHEVRVSVPTLDDGTYIVTWRVTSADAHPVHGAFTFQVGTAATTAGGGTQAITRKLLADQGGDTAVGFVYAVQRVLAFASVIVVVGGAAFLALLWPQGVRDRRAKRVLLVAWVTAAVVTALGIGLQGAYGAGLGLASALKPSVIGDELGTRFGDGSLLRLAFLAVLGVVLLAAVRPDSARNSAPYGSPASPPEFRAEKFSSALWGFAFGAGLAVVATFGWAGHAATGDLHAIGLPADVVHLAAVSLWLGGLTMLAVGVLPRRDDAELARVVPAFSRLALVCVAIIVATGVFQGWRQTRSIDALDSTTYGHLLIIKVVVFGVLVGLAWTARRWVQGRRHDGSVGAFVRTIGLEVTLAVGVIVVTALLVNAQPARSALAQPYSTELTAGPLLIDVTVDPAKAGPADIHVYTLDRQGQVKAVDELDVDLRLPDHDVGPLTVPVQRAGPGHFAAYGFRLPFPGAWQLDVAARIGEVDQYTATTPVRIR